MLIHSLVHLQVKLWQCDSTCRSFAVLDSVLIRDRRASTIAVTMAIHIFSSTLQNKVTNGSHWVFHWAHNDTAWSTMAVTLSVSSRRYLSHPTEQYPEQSSNTDSSIYRGRVSCFSCDVALALVPHYGVTWFSHIPPPWPSNFRSETIHVVTRLAWWLGGWLWGARLIWRYPTRCKLLLSKWLFSLEREKLFLPEI